MRIKIKTDERSFQIRSLNNGAPHFTLAGLNMQQPSKKEARDRLCTHWVVNQPKELQMAKLSLLFSPLWHHWRQWRSDSGGLLTNWQSHSWLSWPLATSYFRLGDWMSVKYYCVGGDYPPSSFFIPSFSCFGSYWQSTRLWLRKPRRKHCGDSTLVLDLLSFWFVMPTGTHSKS